MRLVLLAIRDWRAPLSPAGKGKQGNKGKTEGWEFSQTCWEGEAWPLEFGGVGGGPVSWRERPQLWRMGEGLIIVLGQGSPWGGSRGGWARGGK